ncbi:unnamed protein product [Cyclocybe aegerita]|uniref:Uncharacterized protein n=1 Tax=Cyclocybe aegerita TaxID=1973307 RepID=A0A8S0VZB8_CYCAE|nr:unnamed protein product [Cyclocybe aegerita]
MRRGWPAQANLQSFKLHPPSRCPLPMLFDAHCIPLRKLYLFFCCDYELQLKGGRTRYTFPVAPLGVVISSVLRTLPMVLTAARRSTRSPCLAPALLCRANTCDIGCQRNVSTRKRGSAATENRHSSEQPIWDSDGEEPQSAHHSHHPKLTRNVSPLFPLRVRNLSNTPLAPLDMSMTGLAYNGERRSSERPIHCVLLGVLDIHGSYRPSANHSRMPCRSCEGTTG